LKRSGLYRADPGLYEQRLIEKCAQLGFDGVFAAHSHTTQRAEYKNNAPASTRSAISVYPPYLLFRCGVFTPARSCFAFVCGRKKLSKVTFSVIKMVEDGKSPMRIVPVDAFYQELSSEAQRKLAEKAAAVYSRVTGKPAKPDVPCRKNELN